MRPDPSVSLLLSVPRRFVLAWQMLRDTVSFLSFNLSSQSLQCNSRHKPAPPSPGNPKLIAHNRLATGHFQDTSTSRVRLYRTSNPGCRPPAFSSLNGALQCPYLQRAKGAKRARYRVGIWAPGLVGELWPSASLHNWRLSSASSDDDDQLNRTPGICDKVTSRFLACDMPTRSAAGPGMLLSRSTLLPLW